MFFRSTGIFLHVIFFRYVPIWALRTTTLEIESIEARAGCKSCGLVHLDKTLSLSWSMFPPSPIPGQRSLLDELGKVGFFLQKMCFRSFKKIKKHFAAKEIKSYLLFFKKIRTFSQKFVCFGGNGQVTQCGGTFFSQEIRATFGGPTRIQYLLLLLTKSLCVLGWEPSSRCSPGGGLWFW